MGLSDVNQYSTVRSLFGGSNRTPSWVPAVDKDRLLSYQQYDQIYWSNTGAFQLLRRGAEIKQIYIPNGKTIVDSTAHFLLKGLVIRAAAGMKSPVQDALDTFLKNTSFMSRFMVAKHAGVAWGDWVFHMVGDDEQEEGHRVAIIPIDPSCYFPDYDDDDCQQVNRVILAQEQIDDDGKARIHRLTYWYEQVGSRRRVAREELSVEADETWMDDEKMKVHHVVRPEALLPEAIQNIPVYHFKNQDWMGQPFGSSELRGYERIMSGVNQTISDEELALALEGLGVYASDAGSPVDAAGNATDWEVSPGRVVEVPSGAYFKRVEGLSTVAPMLEHVKYLEEKLWESSGTFRAGEVDVQVAQSQMALSIRFLPQAAKLEERDISGIDQLNRMFTDWTFWWEEFEGATFSSKEDAREIDCKIGEKLPLNRTERITELNNMLDRHVIDREYYREQMSILFGYDFPDDIEDRVEAEREADQEFTLGSEEEPRESLTGQVGPDGQPLDNGDPNSPSAPTLPTPPSRSNNKGRVNESKGTEATQTLQRQQQGVPGRRQLRR